MSSKGGTAFEIAWTKDDVESAGNSEEDFDLICDSQADRLNEEPVPKIKVLLSNFQSQELLDFGSVFLKDGEENAFYGQVELVNDDRNDDVTVHLDRFSARYGFSVGDDIENSWLVPSQDSSIVQIKWTPLKPGGVRQSLTFSFTDQQRHRVHVGAFLCGVAKVNQEPQKGNTRKKRIQVPMNNENRPSMINRARLDRPLPLRERSANKSAPSIAIQRKPQARPSMMRAASHFAEPKIQQYNPRKAQRSLSLRHDSPATMATQKIVRKDLKMRRVLFDARWMEKQERGFAAWLNYVVDPETSDPTKFDSMVEDSPEETMNPLALLARKQRAAAIQRHAYTIYHSREMENVAYQVEREIADGGISIRQDRDMFKDLGLRKLVLDMLRLYNMPWLRLGLETVLGMSVGSSSKAISKVMATYVLGDPELDETFRDSKRGLFDENPEYQRELRKISLRRFLMLVLFLDRAKQASVIDHPSCLFNVKSKIKSSQQMIINYAKEFLAGEGNVLRHLQHSCSYQVEHEQKSLDEFDFKVSNLSVDLRDGVRLTRVVELLTNNKERSLSAILRAPAVSRLQKLHNAGVAVNELENQGIDLGLSGGNPSGRGDTITSKDIVDGNRHKTLSLLWKMIAKWRLSIMLSTDSLQFELDRVLRLHGHTAKKIMAQSQFQQEQQHIDTPGMENLTANQVLDDKTKMMSQMLLKWCQAVCAHHGVTVSNFTTSMASGRAICLLVHHYHPKLLERSSILPGAVELAAKSSDHSAEVDWIPFEHNVMSRAQYKVALQNEQANFRLVNDCANALGCVPVLLPCFDSENVPEEKIMLLFLTYLCARLLASRDEIVAATKIQRVWLQRRRGERLRKLGLRAEHAARAIQRTVRQAMQKRTAKKVQASVVLQKWARSASKRKSFMLLRKAIIKLQSYTRAVVVQAQFLHIRDRVILCQKVVRAFLHAKQLQEQEERLNAIVLLQSVFRQRIVANSCARKKVAATTMQSVWRACHDRSIAKKRLIRIIKTQSFARMVLGKQKLCKIRADIILLQSNIRRKLVRNKFRKTLDSVVKLQSIARMFLRFSLFQDLNTCIRTIQSLQRCRLARMRFLRTKKSTIMIQSMVRGGRVRLEMQKQNMMASKIQATFRGCTIRRYLVRMVKAATKIQRQWQVKSAQLVFKSTKEKIVTVQSLVRGALARSSLQKQTISATKVQAVFRGYSTRRYLVSIEQSCIEMQKRIRAMIAQRKFAQTKAKIVAIQNTFRFYLARQSYRSVVAKIIQIQAQVRIFLAKSQLQRQHRAALAVQTLLRGCSERSKFNSKRKSAIQIQAYWRAALCRIIAKKKLDACTRIQALVRMNQVRHKYVCQKQSILVIEAICRGHLSRVSYLRQISQVILLQACARRLLSTKTMRSKRKASVTIQKMFRMFALRKSFKVKLDAVCKLQSIARGNQGRQEVKNMQHAATKIQAIWKSHSYAESYNLIRSAVSLIQNAERARQARVRYLDAVQKVVSIQAFVRKIHVKHAMRTNQRCACILQAAVRQWYTKKHYTKFKKAVENIQKIWRMKMVVREFHQKRKSIIMVQSNVRMRLAQSHFAACTFAAVRLQAFMRGSTAKVYFFSHRKAAITIEHAVRRWIKARQAESLNKAAVRIQALYRGWSRYTHYQHVRQSIVVCQSVIRFKMVQRWLCYQAESARRIQVVIRCWLIQVHLEKETKAAIHIQRIVRGVQNRAQRSKEASAASKLQATVRGKAVKVKFQNLKHAATVTQAHRRGKLARRQFYKSIQAITVVQAYTRTVIARKTLLRSIHSACIIQSICRTYLTRRKYTTSVVAILNIQDFARKYCLLEMSTRRAVCKIQAHFRGFKARKDMDQDLKGVGRRLAAANAAATESNTLGSRTRSALAWLLNNKNLAQVLKACTTLRDCIATSRECGESFLNSDASDVLFALIRSCNRSEPHRKVLQVALEVMVQVAQQDRHQCFRRLFSSESESVAALLDLLQIFRDKESIASQSLVLLEYYCADKSRVVVNICNDSDLFKRLRSIESLLRRKAELAKHTSKGPSTRLGNSNSGLVHKQQHIRLEFLLQKVESFANV